MSDEIWQRAEVESPCTKVCLIHPGAKICLGCLRTGDEIAAWSRMTHEDRRALMDALPAREAMLTAAGVRASDRTGRRRRR